MFDPAADMSWATDFSSLPESVGALSKLVTELRYHLLQNLKANKALKSDLAQSNLQVTQLTVERDGLLNRLAKTKNAIITRNFGDEVEQLRWERDLLQRKVDDLAQAPESQQQRGNEHDRLLHGIQEEHREEISLLEQQLDALARERDDLKSELAEAHDALKEIKQSVMATSQKSQQAARDRPSISQRIKRGTIVNLDTHRDMLIGKNSQAFDVMQQAQKIAGFDVNVLVTGESGTGKEILARWIHKASQRCQGPFEVIDLPSIPAELFESVLFGHERGSFTGAIAQNQGGFQKAQGGTLFLDEISTLKLDLQPKLLRAIQEKEVKSVGGRKATRCDVRIVAATNVNLADAVKRGEFRTDLFYRLNVVTIRLIPLRERREDIPELVEFFLKTYSEKFNCTAPSVSASAEESLVRHNWPGNIRELENRVQRAMLVARSHHLTADDFFEQELSDEEESQIQFGDCEYSLAEIEREYVNRVLRKTNGNKSQAAQILQIDRKTLRERLRHTSEELHENRTDTTLHLVDGGGQS